MASLDHPGIVKVLRSFEAFGTAYFAMPFVEGVTLDEVSKQRQVQQRPFSESELQALLSRMLDALGYLHDRGIYHRDIKPGNILITQQGHPVLIDFGSARQRLSERSMTVIESAGYTPFEQLESRGNVGPWSDLYALGATMEKTLTGATPPKAMDRMRKDARLPLTQRSPLKEQFSPRFLGAIDKSLEVEELSRWQSSEEWLHGLSAEEVPPAEIHPQAAAPVISTPQAVPVKSPHLLPGQERDFSLGNQTTIRMCWIPQGKFLMGSPEGEVGQGRDETQHWVTISKGFWLAKYPITQAQWQAVMGPKSITFQIQLILSSSFGNPKKDASWGHLPLKQVSWNDICGEGGLIEKLNQNASELARFDLPTEAQWEYACRAGTTGPYAGDLNQMAWYRENSEGKTHPVGLKQANAWGLHDMHGNVWEWCKDWYGTYPENAVVDPYGPASGSYRVLRGGGWYHDALYCRVAYRDYSVPGNNDRDAGFRLARSSAS